MAAGRSSPTYIGAARPPFLRLLTRCGRSGETLAEWGIAGRLMAALRREESARGTDVQGDARDPRRRRARRFCGDHGARATATGAHSGADRSRADVTPPPLPPLPVPTVPLVPSIPSAPI